MIDNDIATAVCNSKQHCAIAQTIYRVLKIPVGRVRVTTAYVSIAKDEYRHYYMVPHKACRLVSDFDAGMVVQPIIFNLTLAKRRKIEPVDPVKKARTNLLRRDRAAALAAQGLKPKTYPKGRYGI